MSESKPSPPCDLTVAEIAKQIRNGSLVPTVLMESLLEQVRRLEPSIKAWTTLDEERALDAALKAVEGGGEPDCGRLAQAAKLPESAMGVYVKFMEILVCHFQELLSRDGDAYQDLLAQTYESKTNFLLFCNQLNSAERELNQALTPTLENNPEADDSGQAGYGEAVSKIEEYTELLRREEAERLFA